jgi:glycosyltransferase involved in cell wall biosynthesis
MRIRRMRPRDVGRVAVLQPYIPSYRVPLFDALVAALPDRELTVVHGSPSSELRARGDAAESAPWAHPVPVLEVGLPRTSLRLVAKRRTGRVLRKADTVVAELSVVSVNSWWLALTRAPSLVLWGHGDSFVRSGGGLRGALESRLARRAARIWTYSEAGRQSLIARGVHPSRVVTIGNSTDTRALQELQRTVVDRAVEHADRWQLTAGHTAVFVGGLDPDKRIDFLLQAAAEAHARDPRFRLLVAGDGVLADLVREVAASTEHVHHVGRADAAMLAVLGTVGDAMWMPGRVGLVAVDCLALGLPLMTTRFPHHAPEIEYLQEGLDRLTLPDEPTEFATQALELMQGPRPVPSGTAVPSVEAVAERMAASLRELAQAQEARDVRG